MSGLPYNTNEFDKSDAASNGAPSEASNGTSRDESRGQLVARERPGDNAEPLSITQISQLLKRTVEDRFGYIRLRGELSGVKRAASGHLYCALKDEKSLIDGVMWRGNAGRLGFAAEDGIEVIVSGKLTTYGARSKYQIVIESMEIAGEGALLALLEKTRARLDAEGLFAASRKRPLPYLPRKIGVITSPTGAVIRDILHRLADRFPTHVTVWPVLVQGQGSAAQVAQAIRGFAQLPGGIKAPDLLIVARGGGSIEDLWGFNEEEVVRAIAECSIPIISAVGHETDTTLADYAADARAPTPTAAAEMAVPVRAELEETVHDFAQRSRRAVKRVTLLGCERLQSRAQNLPKPEELLQNHVQRLDDRAERLRRGLSDSAARGKQRLSALRLTPAMLQRVLRERQQQLSANRFAPALIRKKLDSNMQNFAALERLMESLNPRAPLARGYALVKDAQGHLLRNRTSAAAQPQLQVEFGDGALNVVPLSADQTAENREGNSASLHDKAPAEDPSSQGLGQSQSQSQSQNQSQNNNPQKASAAPEKDQTKKAPTKKREQAQHRTQQQAQKQAQKQAPQEARQQDLFS